MVHTVAFRLTASTLVLCMGLSGCSAIGLGGRSSGQLGSASQPKAADGADPARVRAALGRGDHAAALPLAERLVEQERRNPELRSLLGQAYLANGRYSSARTAFADAMALGAKDRQTVISLAMVETAQGRAPAARALLNKHAANLSAADLGLALALAGDPTEGAAILARAVEDSGGDTRIRQNLAYALALAGEWDQAYLVASRDLAADEVQDRVQRWAILAQPGNESVRVAELLGVNPRIDDDGVPARLGINGPPQEDPARLAAALAAMTPAQRADEPALPGQSAAPIFVSPMLVKKSAPPPRLAVENSAAIRPVVSMAQPPRRLPASASAAFVKTAPPISRARLVSPATSSRFVPAGARAPSGSGAWAVQLGAFADAAGAMTRWQQFARQDGRLLAMSLVATPVQANGATLTRLAIKGFASRDAAMNLCTRLRATGQACFPRQGD